MFEINKYLLKKFGWKKLDNFFVENYLITFCLDSLRQDDIITHLTYYLIDEESDKIFLLCICDNDVFLFKTILSDCKKILDGDTNALPSMIKVGKMNNNLELLKYIKENKAVSNIKYKRFFKLNSILK